MQKIKGTLLTTKSPSGKMLYGDKTQKERTNENKEYKQKNLNENKK
jgi:hypothetical protein